MLTMIPVHRGTATSPRAFFRVKPSKIPATLNELPVTGAVCALSAGGKEACFVTAAFTTQLEKLKMPPTALRAHIAMVTSSSTTPILSICLS